VNAFTDRDSEPLQVPWGALQVLQAGLTAIALFVLALVIGALVAILWARADLPDVSMQVIVQLIFALEALLLIPAWLFGPRRYRLSWASLGLTGTSRGLGAIVAIIGFGLVLVANWAWTLVMGWLDLRLAEQPNPLPYFGGGLTGLAMALFLGAVVAPVAEEVFFRGFLYPGLKRSWGIGWALVASSAIFAVIHGFSAVIPPIFLIGVVLVVSYEVTRSLWPAIAIHAAMNALAFISAHLLSVGGADPGF